MAKIAIIQHAPRVLDREATLDEAVQLIVEAAAGGADLIVFPEAFVPGYPAWVWRLRPGGDWSLSEQIHQLLLENAVDLAGSGLEKVRAAAAEEKEKRKRKRGQAQFLLDFSVLSVMRIATPTLAG